MKRNIIKLTGAILALAAISACHKDNTDPNNNNNGDTYAHIQLVDASPSEQNCDFYDGGSATNPITPGAYYLLATDYRQVLPAQAAFTVKDFTRTAITTPTLSVTAGGVYTFFICDTFPNVTYVLTKDTVPTSLPASTGALKFVNVSPNAGPLSYRIRGGSILASNLQYGGTHPNACASSFINVPQGYQVIEVLDANTLQVIDSLPLYTLSVDAGKSYTIWTGGFRGINSGDNRIQSFYTYDEIVQ
ncbi:MAG TPA: DUF4397 domain-containing protein [Chitinophagales bacterium]|nr:DUF4397 domain-containing protein [Chitinophagales bacterium]